MNVTVEVNHRTGPGWPKGQVDAEWFSGRMTLCSAAVYDEQEPWISPRHNVFPSDVPLVIEALKLAVEWVAAEIAKKRKEKVQ